MDRRIMRSRQMIMQAFIELLGEQDFEKVTIQGIADRANVNRGTVYLHFTDKYDLLEQSVDTYLMMLADSCIPEEGTTTELSRDLFIRAFTYLKEHAAIYSVLITNKGIPTFRHRMTQMIKGNVTMVVNHMKLESDIHRDVLAQFLSVSITGLIEWWVVESMPYTPEEMVEQMNKILEARLQLW
ncbi:TetR family transcriptional regulator [Paenibacillus sp. Root52]|uniref:AcrR family transcriptional regulator n=1 Tax=Paenibacillus amylolyticus TaxID=1451 RepID=A0AAP5H4J6_PAEAM|nr:MULTISPECIES: TetR/AcrR family transcriptional regulator [Paenibacillus]KQY94773.1 TetR family transcriptional regulator [Paenibacillus sp. Root52]MDR6726240.1 AcrR family transcriptional regulator [Paenibacillus amylolyticus]